MEAEKKLNAGDRMEKAFFDLLEEKHYSKITVSELIEKAGVSRTTFYRHYVDIFDMYDKVCEHMLLSFLEKLLSKPAELVNCDVVELFEEFCVMMKAQEKYIALLCGKNGGRKFFEHLIVIVNKQKDFLLLSPDIFTKEDIFKLKFITFAGIGSYVKALIEERSTSEEILGMCRTVLMIVAADKENEQ